MLETLVISLNVVMPVLLLVALGFGLHRLGVMTGDFIRGAMKLIFTVCFPCSIFSSFGGLSLSEVFDGKLLLYMLAVVTVTALIPMWVLPRLVKDPPTAASMAQGMFRTNVLVQGVPLLTNVYGEGNIAAGAFVLPFMILLNNFMTTILFVKMIPDHEHSGAAHIRSSLHKLVTNPLILASAAGILFSAMGWRLPGVLNSAVSQVGRIASPLALLCMGAEIDFSRMNDDLRYSLPTVGVRLVLIPAAATLLGVALGFRGTALGSIFLFTAPCCATTGYIMADSMGGNTDVAAQCICLSALGSALSMTAGLFLLLRYGLI